MLRIVSSFPLATLAVSALIFCSAARAVPTKVDISTSNIDRFSQPVASLPFACYFESVSEIGKLRGKVLQIGAMWKYVGSRRMRKKKRVLKQKLRDCKASSGNQRAASCKRLQSRIKSLQQLVRACKAFAPAGGGSGGGSGAGGSGGSGNTPTPTPTPIPTPTPTPTPSPTPERFVLLDFEDAELHDANWLANQPAGTRSVVVGAKGDSGTDTLSLAVGEGRGGGNALLVEATSSNQGLPGFWVLKHESLGGSYANIYNEHGYLLPRDKRANRVEFWVRFEQGYRAGTSAAQPPAYPNHQNMHFGTYHYDPALIQGGNPVVESTNWHFYHQLWIRHDLAGDEWIRVVLNPMPQHQRSVGQTPPAYNPTLPAGNYFELLTRFYIDEVNYFGNPEKPYPVRMWVDDISLLYEPDPNEVAVDFEDHSKGETVMVSSTLGEDLPLLVQNLTENPISGHLFLNAPPGVNALLQDRATGQPTSNDLTLAAGESRELEVRVSPIGLGGTSHSLGATFIPADQVLSDSSSTNRSITDDNVEKRWFPESGPHDGTVASDMIRLQVQ